MTIIVSIEDGGLNVRSLKNQPAAREVIDTLLNRGIPEDQIVLISGDVVYGVKMEVNYQHILSEWRR